MDVMHIVQDTITLPKKDEIWISRVNHAIQRTIVDTVIEQDFVYGNEKLKIPIHTRIVKYVERIVLYPIKPYDLSNIAFRRECRLEDFLILNQKLIQDEV